MDEKRESKKEGLAPGVREFSPIRPCSTLGLLVKDEQILCSDKTQKRRKGAKLL